MERDEIWTIEALIDLAQDPASHRLVRGWALERLATRRHAFPMTLSVERLQDAADAMIQADLAISPRAWLEALSARVGDFEPLLERLSSVAGGPLPSALWRARRAQREPLRDLGHVDPGVLLETATALGYTLDPDTIADPTRVDLMLAWMAHGAAIFPSRQAELRARVLLEEVGLPECVEQEASVDALLSAFGISSPLAPPQVLDVAISTTRALKPPALQMWFALLTPTHTWEYPEADSVTDTLRLLGALEDALRTAPGLHPSYAYVLQTLWFVRAWLVELPDRVGEGSSFSDVLHALVAIPARYHEALHLPSTIDAAEADAAVNALASVWWTRARVGSALRTLQRVLPGDVAQLADALGRASMLSGSDWLQALAVCPDLPERLTRRQRLESPLVRALGVDAQPWCVPVLRAHLEGSTLDARAFLQAAVDLGDARLLPDVRALWRPRQRHVESALSVLSLLHEGAVDPVVGSAAVDAPGQDLDVVCRACEMPSRTRVELVLYAVVEDRDLWEPSLATRCPYCEARGSLTISEPEVEGLVSRMLRELDGPEPVLEPVERPPAGEVHLVPMSAQGELLPGRLLQMYQALLEKAPSGAQAWRELGAFEAQNLLLDDARESLRRALEIEPASFQTRALMARVELGLDAPARALSCALEMLKATETAAPSDVYDAIRLLGPRVLGPMAPDAGLSLELGAYRIERTGGEAHEGVATVRFGDVTRWEGLAQQLTWREITSLEILDRALSTSPAWMADQVGHAPVRQQTLAKKKKVGRNDPCPCGSGKKHKRCCL